MRIVALIPFLLLLSNLVLCSLPVGPGPNQVADEWLLGYLLYASLPPSPKYIFVSATTTNGNMGGVAGADAICNSDAARPNTTGTYKALLTDASTRVATVTGNVGDGQVNWVLRPNTSYMRPNGATIMTTNSVGLYIFGPNITTAIGTGGAAIWTGLSATWTSNVPTNCSNWTTTGAFGIYGTENLVTSAAFAGGSLSCASTPSLYCVQQ